MMIQLLYGILLQLEDRIPGHNNMSMGICSMRTQDTLTQRMIHCDRVKGSDSLTDPGGGTP